MRVILASSSPRRRELLQGLIGEFDIIPPDVDESSLPGENPRAHAERISGLKAAATLAKAPPDAGGLLIIASDTIVTIDGNIIGKPADHADAVRTLALLSGRTHSVITAVTLVLRDGLVRTLTSSEETGVTFLPMGEDDIRGYLELVHYMDKAGSYAAQEHGDRIIERIDGSVTNVIGFPLRRFFVMLTSLGIINRLPLPF